MPILTHFAPDPERQAVLKDCIDDYGVSNDDGAEWPNNILSRHTVVYGNGAIARQEDAVSFAVDSEELDLCIRLANEAAAIMEGEPVGMGSESDAGFSAFWICASSEQEIPHSIDENLIRGRFGNTIFPPAIIKVEPVSRQSEMFNNVKQGMEDDPDGAEEYQRTLDKWHELVSWFDNRNDFKESACVFIGDVMELWNLPQEQYPPGTQMIPCVLPRMVLGLTQKGNLCGLFGFVVQT